MLLTSTMDFYFVDECSQALHRESKGWVLFLMKMDGDVSLTNFGYSDYLVIDAYSHD